jgi:hypothetical protein
MNARIAAAALAALLAQPAGAALFDVQSMTIDSASFQVTTNNQTGFGSGFSFTQTNLVAGAQNPILAFSLTDPLNANNHGTVTTYTTAASPAQVDTSTGEFFIQLPTFTMDWDTVPPPPGALELCRAAKPCVVGQAPQNALGQAVGSIVDPVTGRYVVSWSYAWAPDQHPFPTGTTVWTLSGIALIPEPGTAVLLAAGLLGLGGVVRRRSRG